jgi:TP901 family phage tail tape measure protein
MPDLVEILVTAKNLTGPAFAEAKEGASAMESTMSKVNKTAALAGVAMVGFLGESIRMASDFDSKMALLNTQAGVSQDKIAGLSKGVLDLAGQVGFSPDSLAESLFHVESNFESMGITSAKALDTTKIAAEGAAVGHANLVDVTNALTAAVASGIPGVENMSQAMGVLNATVGVGDMQMQDLAKAFGSGMVATVKGFGLSIADVGAGLAVFGDNNIRGAAAGTQLRMSVQALAQPVASGADALKRLGLTQSTLADDMQKGGLKLALEDLSGRMTKAGITADQQGEVITQAFGRKAGAGLNVLLSQMDRLESKYPALEAGANGFGDAWEKTQQTFAFQTKQLQASLDALMISLGEKLIPYVQKVVKALLDHKQATVEVLQVTGLLVTALAGFAAISKVVALIEGLVTGFKAASEAMTAYKLRIFEVQAANVAAGGGLDTLGAAFSALGTKAKLAVGATGIGLFIMMLSQLSSANQDNGPDIDQLTTSLMQLAKSGQVAGEAGKTFGTNLDQLGYAVDRVAGKSAGMDEFNDVMNKIFTLGTQQSNSMNKAKADIDGLDQSLAGMVQGGHADLAAAALQRLQEALVKQGKDPAELAGELSKYNNALQGTALEQKVAADSMGALGQQAVDTTAKLGDQEQTAKGLKEAIIDLNDANRKALDGMAGLYAAIDDGTKALGENGRSLHMVNGELDLSNEKARGNEKALSDLAAKTDNAAEAALNNGESWDKVNKIYETGRDNLVSLAEKMGLNEQQAKDLADAILTIPDRTVTVTTKFVNVHTEVGSNGDSYQHGFAHGGIIGAAGGGPRSGMVWVGEQGPELVRLPSGSTVIPSGQSRSMAASADQGAVKVQLEINSGGSAMDELLLQLLRKTIRVQGGNVQTVLGQG